MMSGSTITWERVASRFALNARAALRPFQGMISFVVPAYNEERLLGRTLGHPRAARALAYPMS